MVLCVAHARVTRVIRCRNFARTQQSCVYVHVHVPLGLPMTAIGGTFGALRLTAPWRFQDFERDRSVYPKATMPAAHVHHAQAHAQAHPSHDSSIHDYATAYLPWALRNGARARPLLAVFWEERFDQDLQSVRRELGVEPWRGVAAERLGANSGVR